MVPKFVNFYVGPSLASSGKVVVALWWSLALLAFSINDKFVKSTPGSFVFLVSSSSSVEMKWERIHAGVVMKRFLCLPCLMMSSSGGGSEGDSLFAILLPRMMKKTRWTRVNSLCRVGRSDSFTVSKCKKANEKQ